MRLRLHKPLLIVDRYVLRLMAGSFAAIVGVITFLLCLETIPGLLEPLGKVSSRLELVFSSLVNLVPEYVAVGIPIALFLSTALTFRRLALNGELEVFAAGGFSSARLLRVPFLLAALCCILLIGIRGYVQPAGERELDAVGRSVETGEYGYALEAGVSHFLTPETQLYFGRVSPGSTLLEDVIIDRGGVIMTAASAKLLLATEDRFVLLLIDGMLTPRAGSELGHMFRFKALRLIVPLIPRAPRSVSPSRDRLDRFDFHQLLDFAPYVAAGGGLTAQMAAASASARIAAALFCLVLPLLGFAQGVPPKRSRSAIGIGVGVIEIITFWRLSALIEDRFTMFAPAAHALLVVAFLIVGIQLMRFQQRNGFGAVEQALSRTLQRVRSRLRAMGWALGRLPTGKRRTV